MCIKTVSQFGRPRTINILCLLRKELNKWLVIMEWKSIFSQMCGEAMGEGGWVGWVWTSPLSNFPREQLLWCVQCPIWATKLLLLSATRTDVNWTVNANLCKQWVVFDSWVIYYFSVDFVFTVDIKRRVLVFLGFRSGAHRCQAHREFGTRNLDFCTFLWDFPEILYFFHAGRQSKLSLSGASYVSSNWNILITFYTVCWHWEITVVYNEWGTWLCWILWNSITRTRN